jgi:hypothetical protein
MRAKAFDRLLLLAQPYALISSVLIFWERRKSKTLLPGDGEVP